MTPSGESGIWEIFVPGVARGALYKFLVQGPDGVRGVQE